MITPGRDPGGRPLNQSRTFSISRLLNTDRDLADRSGAAPLRSSSVVIQFFASQVVRVRVIRAILRARTQSSSTGKPGRFEYRALVTRVAGCCQLRAGFRPVCELRLPLVDRIRIQRDSARILPSEENCQTQLYSCVV